MLWPASGAFHQTCPRGRGMFSERAYPNRGNLSSPRPAKCKLAPAFSFSRLGMDYDMPNDLDDLLREAANRAGLPTFDDLLRDAAGAAKIAAAFQGPRPAWLGGLQRVSSPSVPAEPRRPAERPAPQLPRRKGGRRPRTAAQWEGLWQTVGDYYAGELTQEAFCAWRGMGVSTLQNWIQELDKRDPARLAALRLQHGR